jgi:hypothetical protein
LEEIIGVKQGCHLYPTLFDIDIDKLEGCLEGASCVCLTLASIVIILLLYVDDIVLVFKIPHDLNKKLKIINHLCSSMTMNINTNCNTPDS